VIPAGNNQVTVQFVEFGTSLDFVPFVLNENRLRLELRPEISELDPTRGVSINGTTIPGIRQRYVDTAVEMDAGQTWAVAGLIQQRTEAINTGLPFFSDLPYLGSLFRRVSERVNDIEVLFVVTPEFSGALDPHQVPAGGPGLDTTSPSNCELYGKGYIEVPFTSHSGNCEAMGHEAPAYGQTIMNHHVDGHAMPMGSPH
jgi:pilus assembly protein CpaC